MGYTVTDKNGNVEHIDLKDVACICVEEDDGWLVLILNEKGTEGEMLGPYTSYEEAASAGHEWRKENVLN